MTAIALALLAAFLFGATFITARVAWEKAPTIEGGAIVINAVACAIVVAVAVAAGTNLDSLSLHDQWPFLVAGVLAPGLAQLFLLKAVGAVGATRSAIVIGATPVLSATAAIIFLSEPLTAGFAVGTAAIACGAVALTMERAGPATPRTAGLVFALAGAAMFAARDNLLRSGIRGSADVPPLLAASTLLVAATVTTVVYGLAVRRAALGAHLRSAALPFLPSGLVIGIAYACLAGALARARVTVVTPLTATQTLWATLLALVFLGSQEAIGRRLAISSLVILAGAAVVGATR